MIHPGNSRRWKRYPYRSLVVQEWPEADRKALEEACRPGVRLKPGGRASHFAEASLKDFTNRYGAYLGSLQRRGVLNLKAAAAAQVTGSSVTAYVAELKARVSSVTTWNCIYKLRRMSQLLNSKMDFAWLVEIEQELALVMVPRSKFDRLVLKEQALPSWEAAVAEDWLGKWAMNQMLINVATRKFARSVRLRLTSASHDYVPSCEPEGLAEMHKDWQRRYGKLMHR